MKHLTHRDQIHRDVEYDPLSRALIDSPQMQRLGKIYQLGFAHLVFRGGTHTRLSHVMGVAAIAETLVNGLKKNYEIAVEEKWLPLGAILPNDFLPTPQSKKADLNDRWEVLLHLVRWGSLLHDIGHVPLGHTLEDEFADIYQKHDSFKSERIPYLWNEIAPGKNSPIKDIFLNEDLYPKCFKRMGYQPIDAWQIVLLICLYKDPDENAPSENLVGFEKLYYEAYQKFNGKGFHQYMADIVADTICADYLDYLQRDTVNVGLDPVKETRIIQNYFVGCDQTTNSLRMALSLVDKGGKPKLSTVTAAKNMVRHRFDLAEIIYYHKTKVAASAMLAKVFSLIDKPKEVGDPRVQVHLNKVDGFTENILSGNLKVEDLKNQCLPDSLLHPIIGDETLILWLQEKAWKKLEEASMLEDVVVKAKKMKDSLLAISLLESITERNLFKVALSLDSELVGHLSGTSQPAGIEAEIKKILKAYRPGLNEVLDQKEKNRDKLERLMAEAVELPNGAFISYVPGRKVQAKGIETGALDRSGKVITLGKHNTVKEEVDILNTSYQNLWRFLVFVHPQYRNNPVTLSIAIDAFLKQVFPNLNFKKAEEYIKQACYFMYIPDRYRTAALDYLKRNNGDDALCDWKSFENVESLLFATTGPTEYADLAQLLSLTGEASMDKIKSHFGESGTLTIAIHKEMESVESESSKGKADSENRIRAIAKIAEDILKDDKSLNLF